MYETMSRILITGVAGFLGSHLADSLIQADHEVIGCDNLLGGSKDNVPDDVEFHEADCNNISKMKDLTENVEVVYHAAAVATEGLSVFSPSMVTKHVYQNSASVISAACENDVERFVYMSSMARYGEKDIPFTEETPAEPEDPYGLAKVAAEDLLKMMGRTHGMDWSIAVPHNIIGPRQKFDDPFRNVVAIFANRMLQGKQPIIYGDGEQKRCFSDVEDCIQCLEKMGFSDEAEGEVINIGPDEEENFITINQLAEHIAQIVDLELDPIYVGERTNEVKVAHCSADKARDLLNYETQWGLKESLQKEVQWIRQVGPQQFDYLYDLEIVNEKTPRTWTDELI